MNLVANHPQAERFAVKLIDKLECFQRPFTSIAGVEGDQILWVAVFDGFTPYDCNIHLAIAQRKGIRRGIRAVFDYAFNQLNLKRVTALVGERNHDSQVFCLRAGMRREGHKREGLGNEDEVIYGMIRKECKWVSA